MTSKISILSLVLFHFLAVYSQEIVGTPPEELRSFSHPGTTASRPLSYNEIIVPPQGYYISFAEYSYAGVPERKPGCAWCHPTEGDMGIKILEFGHKLTINRTCDGLSCDWGVKIKYKKYFIDAGLILLSSDPEENLQSRYWLENKSSQKQTVVYKIESYDGTGNRKLNYRLFEIASYSKLPIESKYYKIDNRLHMYYVTLLYMNKY